MESYLWNQLPSSFRQPHSVHCPPSSPHPVHVTSSQSQPSLSPSITPSVFHSRHHLFHKSFHPSCFGLPSQILDRTKLTLAFVCFSFFFFCIFVLVSCARFSWTHSAFQSTLIFYHCKLIDRHNGIVDIIRVLCRVLVTDDPRGRCTDAIVRVSVVTCFSRLRWTVSGRRPSWTSRCGTLLHGRELFASTRAITRQRRLTTLYGTCIIRFVVLSQYRVHTTHARFPCLIRLLIGSFLVDLIKQVSCPYVCTWLGSVAVGRWTRGQEIAGSTPTAALFGQQPWAGCSHLMCLCSPSSIIRYLARAFMLKAPYCWQRHSLIGSNEQGGYCRAVLWVSNLGFSFWKGSFPLSLLPFAVSSASMPYWRKAPVLLCKKAPLHFHSFHYSTIPVKTF